MVLVLPAAGFESIIRRAVAVSPGADVATRKGSIIRQVSRPLFAKVAEPEGGFDDHQAISHSRNDSLLGDSGMARSMLAVFDRVTPSHPILINVGMVSTGTRCFHRAMQRVGLNSAHVGPCNVPYDLSGADSVMGKYLAAHDVFSDIPFCHRHFIEAAALYARRHPERISLVATVRGRDSWANSMVKGPQKGGCVFRQSYDVRCGNITKEDWLALYDKHLEILRRHNITMLVGTWTSICATLHNFPRSMADACWAKLKNDTLKCHEGGSRGRLLPVRDKESGACNTTLRA